MVAAYPPGGTLLDTFKRSFADVPVDPQTKAVSTSEFLEAADSLKALLDIMGPAFGLSKTDMTKNIEKIRQRQLAAPLESQTLQDLVKNELTKTKDRTASEGLYWLWGGLQFTCKALQDNLDQPEKELSVSFTDAYKTTHQPRHQKHLGWAAGKIAQTGTTVAISTLPYRKDFYAKLGDDVNKVIEQLKTYVAAMGRIIDILEEMLATLPDNKWKLT